VHRGELIFHKDTEDAEFRKKPNPNIIKLIKLADRQPFFFLPYPKLRVLCVSVVN
jgi:hypothetical protein